MPYNCCIIVLVAFLAAIPWISADASKTMVTVSGASSGATMATQLHFAFSKDISGCAVLAGPPYYCAGSLLTAAKCLSGPVTSVSIPSLERKLVAYEKDGSIDKLANIQQNPVYIFTGKYDPVALPGIVKLNEKLYSAFGANIKTNYDMPATHGFATETFGDPCAIPNLSTFINNCNFSLAYDLLNHLHGGGLTKPERGYTTPLVGQMLVFDQEAFMHPPPALSVGNSPTARWLADSVSLYNPHNWGWLTSGLFNWTLPTVTDPVHKAAATRRTSFSFDDTGLVYFPSACATKQKCAIHVALHGCKQGKAYVDDIFVRKAGYLEVAELNNLIVIFPQVRSSLLSPINPMGCWDWWGYTNKSFSTKTGPQMAGVKKMIDTVRMINEAIAAAATVAK